MTMLRRNGLFLIVIVLLGLIARIYLWEPNSSSGHGDEGMDVKGNATGDDTAYVTVQPVEYDFFAEYRLQREITRSKEMDLLREVINNEKYDAEIRKKAQTDLLALIGKMEKELESENLIKAKGVKDAIVMIGDEGVNVVVSVNGAIEEHVAKIGEATARVTGRRMDEITIIPY